MSKAIREAYVGAYASGKSEIAVNRALELADKKENTTLVDLDLVEPFYTLRPLKGLLKEKGIHVIAWDTKELFGTGETGMLIKPEARWVLAKKGNVILDIGYGVEGIKVLNLLHGYDSRSDLKIYAVINTCRPETATVKEIIEHIRNLGNVDGLINNSHLGTDTDAEVIKDGAAKVKAVSQKLSLPLLYTAVLADKKEDWDLRPKDLGGIPIHYIKRYMPSAHW